MVSQIQKSIQLVALMTAALVWANATAVCQEFKIETAIYAGDAKLPVAQNVTLFQNDLIVDLKVDFANPPNVLETKIYDSRQKKVTLLDHARSIRLEISDNRLLQMVDGLRRDISQKKDLQFLVSEVFEETEELETSRIVLKSPTIRYQVEGQRPTDSNYLPIHGEFLDIFTRLSASDPGGFPPFARLRLNESIKKMGWIPTSVEIEMGANALVPKGVKMKSTHVLIDGLSTDDLAKIEAAKKQWLGYPVVNLLKFRGIDQTASADNQSGETTATK
ncbi:hypothetical protein [Mariniblastus fucicola]|uniref:Uncharacterized protein n=1 Tax=Mariniblastus fucicola TaxID=980251 RepID=A0A5B9PF42_9BACT|nr:hypothetical protein [Mariniblastus fucicola]QEG21523.1 hypothetical protein MFFC18_13790 [Mariniblastus fucicola]